MAIRFPLKTVLSANNNDELGAGSALGVIAIPFTIPQDTDNVTVKLTATIVGGGGVSAQLQTTDDGGTTWYGVARTSLITAATGDKTEWLSVPVDGFGLRGSSIIAVGSVVSGMPIGNAAPSTLSIGGGYTGMPILSTTARIALQMNATAITSSSILTEVKVNSQSASA